MESFKSEIFLGWKIQGFFRILIIEKEKFIFWEFPICWNITGIEFLPIETIWNYWLIFELFHLGPNSPALNGQIDYEISNKKTFFIEFEQKTNKSFFNDTFNGEVGLEMFHIHWCQSGVKLTSATLGIWVFLLRGAQNMYVLTFWAGQKNNHCHGYIGAYDYVASTKSAFFSMFSPQMRLGVEIYMHIR